MAIAREAEPVGSLHEVREAGLDRDDLLGVYRHMLVTRGVEERGHILYRQGKIPGSFYTGRGNEAAAVGVATAHIRVGVIGNDAVSHASDDCFCNPALGRNFIGYFKAIRLAVTTCQINELFGRVGDDKPLAVREDVRRFEGRMIFLPIRCYL